MTNVCCPDCGGPILTGTDGARRILYCPDCAQIFAALPQTRETELKLPGLDRGVQAHKIRQSEAELVARICTALRAAGYVVQRVGQYRPDYAGTDRGVADLLVRDPAWQTGLCQQQEVKLPGAAVAEHQKALSEAGVTVIVRSPMEAIMAAQQHQGRAEDALTLETEDEG